MHHLWADFMHWTGSDNVAGPEYGLTGFWSGFGGDLTLIFAVVAYPFITWKRHSCQLKGCWRIGRHSFTDPDDHVIRLLCARHHPSVRHKQLTRERLGLYLGERPGHG